MFKLIVNFKKEIAALKKEVMALSKTVETLKKEITNISYFNQALAIGPDEFPEMTERNFGDHEEYSMLHDRVRFLQRVWVSQRPSLLIKKIFHGGCLPCSTPEEKGIGICLGCQYMGSGWDKPNLNNNDIE